MWKPSEVVPEHKRYASVLWMGLLVAITAFAVRLTVKAIQERMNPNSSYEQSDSKYTFPTVDICLDSGRGCDYEANVRENCLETWDAYAAAYFYGDSMLGEVHSSEHGDACVLFGLSNFDVGDGLQDRTNATTAEIEVYWLASVGESNLTYFTQAVDVYLVDDVTSQSSSAIAVPYSRIVNGSYDDADLYTTTMTIGLTVKKFLDKSDEALYSAWTISTETSHEEVQNYGSDSSATSPSASSSSPYSPASTSSSSDDDFAYVIGYLHLKLTEAALSKAELTEINPLDVLELFGSVGGLWEILMMAWTLIFVSTVTEGPTLRARTFRKPFTSAWGTTEDEDKNATGDLEAGEVDEERPVNTARD